MGAPIIVIDDDRVFREVLARSLINLNCEVTHFCNPSDAMKPIREFDSSSDEQLTVLLDLKLEEDSGLKWIKKIRDANAECRILLLTGYASIATAVEAIKLGADDYLAKPITAREILHHLKKDYIESVTVSDKPMSVERLAWEHIQKVMHDNQGNISASARALGMHRRTLQRKLLKKPSSK